MTPDIWNPQPSAQEYGWRSFRPTSKEDLKWIENLVSRYAHPISSATKQMLCQAIVLVPESGRERLAGLIYWARGAVRQRERDQWIGWSSRSRTMGISQVVELRQFIAKDPDYKIDMLREALTGLPEIWEKAFGVSPLLVVGIGGQVKLEDEDFEALGWTPVSSPGNVRKLWLWPLVDPAREILSNDSRRRGEKASLVSAGFENAYDRFDVAAIRDLVRRMAGIKDARRKHRNKLPLKSLLAVICLSRLDGNCKPAPISNWSRRLTPNQLRALGLGGLDSNKDVVVLSHDTMSRVLSYLVERDADHKEVESQFRGWLDERGIEFFWGRRLCCDYSRKSRSSPKEA